MKPNFKLAVKIIGAGTLTYFLLCLGLWRWQGHLIYNPIAVIKTTPDKIGLTYQDVSLSISKSENIYGWWIPATTPSRGVVLFFHGKGGNIGSYLGKLKFWQQLGFDVFMIDYRGYGSSLGEFPDEAQVYEDAAISWDYLVKQRKINPKDIFIYGYSLGGAIAIDLALKHPESGGLIVESTFSSMIDMANNQKIYKLFPIDLILNQRFDSLSKVKLLKTPILLIHGADDPLVPAWMSQVLFDNAQVPKKILIVPGAKHGGAYTLGKEKYLQAWKNFYQLVRENQS